VVLMHTVLKACGFKLRADDPASMKVGLLGRIWAWHVGSLLQFKPKGGWGDGQSLENGEQGKVPGNGS